MNSRMKELVNSLNDLAYKYYVLDNPTVADSEYDKLYDELVTLEKQTGIVLPDSPTRRVGGELLKNFQSHQHLQRLYSLDKCQEMNELSIWLEKNKKDFGKLDYTLEYKYDGLTLNITYEEGLMQRATTRGNGIEGEDVTEQAKTIKTIPLSIDYQGLIEIQGEVIMKLSVLSEYNNTHDDFLKNARNAAAGAIRNLDPKVTKERNLDFIAYNIGYSRDKNFVSQNEMHEFLLQNKFFVGDYYKLFDDIEDLKKSLEEIENNREKLDYLIDGAVIKINDGITREKLGFTEKFPKWAMAFKFKAEEATTILKDVIWQISRTGKLNPLAIVDPVDVGGATIRRCTLSNYSEIKRKDLKVNSKVFIRRSNDVIPEILGVSEHYENSKEIIAPTICPSCGSQLVWDSVFLKCTNVENCAPAVIAQLTHFASKEAMNIEGLSEKTIEQLYNELNVKTLVDVYMLQENQLLTLDGIKERKAKAIIGAIQSSKKTKFSSFLYALGIPNIGKKAARELADKFQNLDALKQATYQDIIAIDDFGEIMANAVVAYFANKVNIELLDKLLDLGINFEDQIKVGILSGAKFVVTGTLVKLKRSEIHELILNNGGDVSDSISKSVTYLIAGEQAGSKLEKAQKLGIKVISEQEFFDMIGKD